MFRVWRLGLLFLALAACLPSTLSAQSFSFSIGGGHGHHGGHHGHHHHHHGWGVGYHWCSPPPYYGYYYAPPRVTYVQPLVVQPALVQPTVVQSPATRIEPASVAKTDAPAQTLQIWNSGGRRLPVAFLANSQTVELNDGQSHTFYGGGPRVVEFDRGGAFGTARYELTGGQHEFIATSRGWDLVPKASDSAAVASRPSVPKNSLPAGTATR